MPGSGSLIIRPIEAHFPEVGDLLDHMSPYCDLQLGSKHVRTEICKNGGANPFWHHPLVVPISKENSMCTIEIKDEHLPEGLKGTAGKCDIDIEELRNSGNLRKWYTLYRDGHCEGDILIEASFLPELPPFFGCKSAPCTNSSSSETVKEKSGRSEEACGRQEQQVRRRKISECNTGRGWNLYVPGDTIEEEMEDMDDLNLKKSKSVVLDENDVEITGKMERRKSFWEKLLNF